MGLEQLTQNHQFDKNVTIRGDILSGADGVNLTTIIGTIAGDVGGAIHVTNFSATKTFTSADTNNVFHFDTTTQPLCAIFPSTLPDGFNVAIMNTGTNNLRLSAAQINSIGVVIGIQYGGAFVYKDNNQLFAVGRL